MAVTDDKILIMFQKYLDRSSAERQEQTRAFTDSLEAMRKEMRIFNVLTIFALLVPKNKGGWAYNHPTSCRFYGSFWYYTG